MLDELPEVLSKVEIQLQFIVFVTKVRGKVLYSSRFHRNTSKRFQRGLSAKIEVYFISNNAPVLNYMEVY